MHGFSGIGLSVMIVKFLLFVVSKTTQKEVQSGYECGIGIENFNDIKVGDIIECYFLEEIKPELE